jgi:hypothetical protein
MMSKKNPKAIMHQAKGLSPTGVQTRTNIKVVQGRKMMPSSGTRNSFWNARANCGQNSHSITSAKRGPRKTNARKKQHIAVSLLILVFS